MLERIECDKFNEQIITFHKGLNVVLGDDIASNSIGKSTLLMIIDFVFGGNDYIKINSDARQELGEHSFKFTFNFSGEKLFFIRSTNNSKLVSICDEKFQLIREITLNEFTKILQKKYKCELYATSFREIVGRYFRVYGKENLSEKKPLKYYDRESLESSINTLIKF